MANLSITTAWNEASAFVARENRLLFPLAFMLVSLPVALVGLLTPQPAAPGVAPAAGLWLLLLPIALLVTTVGNLAISYLALKPATTVGEAISHGLRRLLPLVGAALLLFLIFLIAIMAIAVVMVMLVPGAASGAAAGVPSPALETATGLTLLVLLPFMLFFGARLMLLNPVTAAEAGGPIAILSRSWALTRGHTWKLIGFLLLSGIAISIVSLAVQSILGLLFIALTGSVQPGSTGALVILVVMAAVNMVVVAYFASLVARIYVQLAGSDAGNVFA